MKLKLTSEGNAAPPALVKVRLARKELQCLFTCEVPSRQLVLDQWKSHICACMHGELWKWLSDTVVFCKYESVISVSPNV